MALGSRGIDSFQDSISSYTKGVRSALAFNQEIELTQEYIAKQPYSFIRVDLGRGANIVMVLMQAENNFFTWVSATGEKIITYNGKIIKTSGLTHNVEIIKTASVVNQSPGMYTKLVTINAGFNYNVKKI